ncbi:hypothetical protein D3C78_1525550 [compost metagenome]
MGPGQVGRQVDAGDHVLVVELAAQPIAPAVAGIETIIVAFLGRIAGPRGARCAALARGQACRPWQLTGTKGRAAAKAQIGTVSLAQAIDMVVAHLPHQRQAAGTQYLVKELGGGHLRLRHRHALVAIDFGAQAPAGKTGGDQR